MIVILVAAILVCAMYFGVINIGFNGQNVLGPTVAPTQIPGGGVGGVFAGNLAVSFTWVNHGNLDAATATNGTVKIYHADGSLFGTTAVAGTITNLVKPEDYGKLSVVVTPVAGGYVEKDWTVAQNSGLMTSVTPTVISGVTVYKFNLDVANQAPLGGGETSRAINLIMGTYIADVSGLAYTSVINATSADLSGTSYLSMSTSGYITGLTQTDAFKIVKVELSMPDAANISMYDNGQVKNLQVIIGLGNGQTPLYISSWQHYTGGTYLEGQIGVADVSQEYYGIPVVYGVNDASAAISYTVNIQGANFAAHGDWTPTLIVTYISPAGVTGTISRCIEFADT